MTYASQTSELSIGWGPTTVVTAVSALLVAFWSTVALEWIGVTIPFVRAVLGVVLLTIVPGGLLTLLLGVRTRNVGEAAIFAVGLSLVTLSVASVLLSLVLPRVGLDQPLSFGPVATLSTVLVVALSVATWLTRRDQLRIDVPLGSFTPAHALLGLLPVFAVVGAAAMRWYGNSYGVAVFVLAVAVVTVLSATRLLQARHYPLAVFLVALSTLLHRSLVATHVVGADIQFNYFLSGLIAESHRWAPDVGGSLASLPVLAAVPAVYSTVAGIELTVVFTVVYSIIFSVVPLGIYYLGRDLFDADIALYGSLIFVFYHGTFYLTPGKQRISELFVVLLLLLYFRHGPHSTGERVAGVLLAIGLVQSHYGATYVYGFAFLIGSVGIVAVDRFVGECWYSRVFSPIYPAAFLVGATAWYAYASPALIGTLASIPASMVIQLLALPSGVVAGSGAGYVQAQEAVVQRTTLGLYVLLTLSMAVGLAWKTTTSIVRIRRGVDVEYAGFTALAVPLFLFLGSSYVLVVDLWADRVYQLVLPVLGLFAALGFSLARTAVGRVPRLRKPTWSPVAVVLAVLFVLNAGLAGAAMGSPTDYTFDGEAHDYSFSDDELEAAEWIEALPQVERIDPETGAEAASEAEPVRVYTDRTTAQLFRSVTPEGHYNVEVVAFKDEWDPTFDPGETLDGYVFVRHDAVEDAHPEEVALAFLSDAHVEELLDERELAHRNGDVTVLEPAGTGDASVDRTPEAAEFGR